MLFPGVEAKADSQTSFSSKVQKCSEAVDHGCVTRSFITGRDLECCPAERNILRDFCSVRGGGVGRCGSLCESGSDRCRR